MPVRPAARLTVCQSDSEGDKMAKYTANSALKRRNSTATVHEQPGPHPPPAEHAGRTEAQGLEPLGPAAGWRSTPGGAQVYYIRRQSTMAVHCDTVMTRH